MDFTKILKSAWDITRKHRFLWWLGILAAGVEGGTGGGVNFGSYSFGGSDLSDSQTRPITHSVSQALNLNNTGSVGQWFATYWAMVAFVALIVLCLIVLFTYIAYSAKSGLIKAVDQLEHKEDRLTFGKSFKLGRPFVWQLFKFDLLVGLVVLALIIIVTTPVALAVIWPNVATIGLAIIIGLVGLLIFLPLSIYLGIVSRLASRHIVLHDSKVIEAFRQVHNLVRHKFSQILLTWLVSLAINLVCFFVVFLAMAAVAGIFISIGIALYFIQPIVALVYGILVGLAFFATCIAIGGVLTTFISSYWTLSYRELTK